MRDNKRESNFKKSNKIDASKNKKFHKNKVTEHEEVNCHLSNLLRSKKISLSESIASRKECFVDSQPTDTLVAVDSDQEYGISDCISKQIQTSISKDNNLSDKPADTTDNNCSISEGEFDLLVLLFPGTIITIFYSYYLFNV